MYEQVNDWDLSFWIIAISISFLISFAIGILILQAGQRLSSIRLQIAGFLWIIQMLLWLTLSLSFLNF